MMVVALEVSVAIGACGGGGGIGGGLRGIGGGVGDGGCTLTTSPAQERVREPACKMGAEQHVEEHGTHTRVATCMCKQTNKMRGQWQAQGRCYSSMSISHAVGVCLKLVAKQPSASFLAKNRSSSRATPPPATCNDARGPCYLHAPTAATGNSVCEPCYLAINATLQYVILQ